MKILSTLLLAAAVSFVSLPSRADFSAPALSNLTNTIGKATTESANVGDAIKIDKTDTLGMCLSFCGDAATNGNIVLTFARSPDNSTWETTPQFTWTVVNNASTNTVCWTNWPDTVIGCAPYLKLVSVSNTNPWVNLTNFTLYLIRKTIKPSP
jgi:hypothetical protein